MRLSQEEIYTIYSKLYELGIEWCLGPETLLNTILNRETDRLDIAVNYVDVDRLHEFKDLLAELGIENVFVVPYVGFSRRCVYVQALPCISIEDSILGICMDYNAKYFEVIKELLNISRDRLDIVYLRVMCRRLGICDKLCEKVNLCIDVGAQY